jgi:hypothetical protein
MYCMDTEYIPRMQGSEAAVKRCLGPAQFSRWRHRHRFACLLMSTVRPRDPVTQSHPDDVRPSFDRC